MPKVFYSFSLGLPTRTPEAAPGFYKNEIPAVRQRNQVHHLPGESENLFHKQTGYSYHHNFLDFTLCIKSFILICCAGTQIPHGEWRQISSKQWLTLTSWVEGRTLKGFVNNFEMFHRILFSTLHLNYFIRPIRKYGGANIEFGGNLRAKK